MYAKPLRERLEGTTPRAAQAVLENRRKVSRQVVEQIKVLRTDPDSLPAPKRGYKRVTDVQSLQLEYIFGYRGFDCTNNVHYVNDATEIVFHTAGSGIVLNLTTGHQRFYLEHSDDILCLTVNQNPRFSALVASAQIDIHRPTIHIWNVNTMKTVSIIQTEHSRGVNCVSFSPSGKYLLSVGIDDEHTLTVCKWQDGSIIASGRGHTNKICDAKFRPDSDGDFVTAGIKHVKFWKICGSQVISKKGVLNSTENAKMHTMLSIGFAPDNFTYTGCVTGDIFVWKDEKLQRIIRKAHQGPIFCMFTSLSDGLIVTGAKEHKSNNSACVKLWDQQLARCRSFPVQSLGMNLVKSVCRQNEKIVIGTKSCDIVEVQEQTGAPYFVLHSHGDGELWGLSTHPSKHIIATVSYDRTLRIWDLDKKAMLLKRDLDTQAVCVDFSPDGALLAVGLINGQFLVLHSVDLTQWASRRDRSTCVNQIRFSPDGKFLAVGYEEAVVDLYNVVNGPISTRLTYSRAPTHSVAHMDFSADSKFIKLSTIAFEVLILTVPAMTVVSDQNDIKSIVWANWTDVAGEEVRGIWPTGWQQGEVNSTDLSHMGATLATGDDRGFVKLFPFPCRSSEVDHVKYIGHSAHVTNVKFSFDDSHLVSTGGDDTSVFVWRCVESS